MTQNPKFTLEIALQTADDVIFRSKGRHLKDIETVIFCGAWRNETYDEIAEKTGYTRDYLTKDIGCKLWRYLSNALNEEVAKTNFKAAIKREWQKNTQANLAQRNLQPTLSLAENLTFPEGPIALDSPFYLSRSNCESVCYQTITEPGSLIRIKGAKWMGKTSLVNRILQQGRSQAQKTVYLDCGNIKRSIAQDLDLLLPWLCVMVSRQLELNDKVKEYWDTDILGSNDNCSVYFEEYILAETSSDIVLALDNIDRLFCYGEVIDDFFGMLRSWHEQAKVYNCWAKLKLVLAHSTEVYVPLDIEQSPFNTGVPIMLEEFTLEQVEILASLYQLDWSRSQIERLMDLIGGHPYLIRLALYQIKTANLTIEQFIRESFQETGIYGDLLRRLLNMLKQSPELISAFTRVVRSNVPVELNPLNTYHLHSIGLVRQQDNLVFPRCKLYQIYFNRVLPV